MMTRSVMQVFGACAAVVSFCGCISIPLNEYNYYVELPSSVEVNSVFVLDVAKSLAAETGLQIQACTSPTGNVDVDSVIVVDLRSQQNERIFVRVLADDRRRTLSIRVMGDIESKEVKDISEKSKDLLVKMFPEAEVIPYTTYRGCLGP